MPRHALQFVGVIHEIVQDQREPGKACIRIDLDGVKTRPAFSMSFEDAAHFSVGTRVTITIDRGMPA